MADLPGRWQPTQCAQAGGGLRRRVPRVWAAPASLAGPGFLQRQRHSFAPSLMRSCAQSQRGGPAVSGSPEPTFWKLPLWGGMKQLHVQTLSVWGGGVKGARWGVNPAPARSGPREGRRPRAGPEGPEGGRSGDCGRGRGVALPRGCGLGGRGLRWVWLAGWRPGLRGSFFLCDSKKSFSYSWRPKSESGGGGPPCYCAWAVISPLGCPGVPYPALPNGGSQP